MVEITTSVDKLVDAFLKGKQITPEERASIPNGFIISWEKVRAIQNYLAGEFDKKLTVGIFEFVEDSIDKTRK